LKKKADHDRNRPQMELKKNMPVTWKQFERYWYILSLMVIVAGLPFSKLLLSIGQFMMAGGWVVGQSDYRTWLARMREGPAGRAVLLAVPVGVWVMFSGIAKGFRQFFSNRAALLFTSIMLMHLAGLLWTTDFNYAMKDLRTKLPLFLLPLFLSTSGAFGKKAFYRFILLFVLAVLVRSLFNAWMIAVHHYIDIRDVSHNISHIIFSLMLSLSIYALVYFLLKRNFCLLWQKGIMLIILAWLLAYIIISQSFTGLSITLAILIFLVPVLIFKSRNRWLKTGLGLGILVFNVTVFLFLRSVVGDYYQVNPIDLTRLEKTTSRGNPYINSAFATETENGNYLWIYIQWDELRGAWNKRSRIPFDSLNLKSGPVAYTVIRYLTSKGWRKDADAVEKLSPEEITAIEKGIANQIFLKKFGIRGRIYEFLWGFDNYRSTGNPTGSTLMQRLEFWKASLGIIRENWLTGVGTGDMNLAFDAQYEKMHTKLAPDQRWRSHNQFLSIFIGFGIFGLLWFLAAILYPPVMLRRFDDYFFFVFLIIFFLSMLMEDTIESQTGVTFAALFYSFFLFARKEKDPVFNQVI